MVGAVISAERLIGVQVGRPRCDLPAATLWRRFDFLGRERPPLLHRDAGRCHRRPMRSAAGEAALFRLSEAPNDRFPRWRFSAGTAYRPPSQVRRTRGQVDRSPVELGDHVSVTETEQLVADRQRALGKKHAVTTLAGPLELQA